MPNASREERTPSHTHARGQHRISCFLFATGPDSRSYAVGALAPGKPSLAQVAVSPKAAAHSGGLAAGFYSGYAAGKAAGDGLNGVLSANLVFGMGVCGRTHES